MRLEWGRLAVGIPLACGRIARRQGSPRCTEFSERAECGIRYDYMLDYITRTRHVISTRHCGYAVMGLSIGGRAVQTAAS